MSRNKGKEGILVIAVNRKARRDYQIGDVYEAGIVLLGSEVKSIRAGGINLADSYLRVKSGELFLVGCHISPYSHSGPALDSDLTVRDRKLLLHKKEIVKLGIQTQHKGLTLVPLQVYFKNGKCKLEFGLGKGKKLHDKREDIKAKEAKREIDRVMRRNQKG